MQPELMCAARQGMQLQKRRFFRPFQHAVLRQRPLPPLVHDADEAAAAETTAAAVTEEIAEAQPAAADVDAEDEAPADEKTSEEFWAQDESQLKLDPPPAPAAEDEAAAPDYAAFKGVKFSE